MTAPLTADHRTIVRTAELDGTIRFALVGPVSHLDALHLSIALVKDLHEHGHRSFVLDLSAAGAIDPRVWSKLTDWTYKLQQVRKDGEQPPRFHFEGVSAEHRAAIAETRLSNVYSVRGPS